MLRLLLFPVLALAGCSLQTAAISFAGGDAAADGRTDGGVPPGDVGPTDSRPSDGPPGDTSIPRDTAAPCTGETCAWWDRGWAARRALTVDGAWLGEDVRNLPVLVRLGPSRIDYEGTNGDGSDVRIVAADGTLLPHELERWTDGGQSALWFLLPLLPAGGQATVFLYYDNEAASSTSDGAAVFGGSYESVHHFQVISRDSTGHGHDASSGASPTRRSGIAAAAADFDGVDDYLELANESAFDFTDRMTIECWFRTPTWSRRWQTLVAKGDHAWRLHRDDTTSALEFGTTDTAGSHHNVGGTMAVDDDAWHHVAIVFDGSEKRMFVDGALDLAVSWSMTIGDRDDSVYIGENNEVRGRFFEGRIDELRIGGTAHRDAWIQASWRAGDDALVSYADRAERP